VLEAVESLDCQSGLVHDLGPRLHAVLPVPVARRRLPPGDGHQHAASRGGDATELAQRCHVAVLVERAAVGSEVTLVVETDVLERGDADDAVEPVLGERKRAHVGLVGDDAAHMELDEVDAVDLRGGQTRELALIRDRCERGPDVEQSADRSRKAPQHPRDLDDTLGAVEALPGQRQVLRQEPLDRGLLAERPARVG
jgi:hypothetical protein